MFFSRRCVGAGTTPLATPRLLPILLGDRSCRRTRQRRRVAAQRQRWQRRRATAEHLAREHLVATNVGHAARWWRTHARGKHQRGTFLTVRVRSCVAQCTPRTHGGSGGGCGSTRGPRPSSLQFLGQHERRWQRQRCHAALDSTRQRHELATCGVRWQRHELAFGTATT